MTGPADRPSSSSGSAERRSVQLTAMPLLGDLQADPDVLKRLPLTVLVDLRRQVRNLDADLDAAIAQQMAQEHNYEGPSKVVDVETAAQRLGTSPDSLYRKRKRLKLGYIDPLDGRLKFTEQELAEYVERQRRR